ncbi:MAG: hypothetical protein U0795_18035 [Pirellulales bacterium]
MFRTLCTDPIGRQIVRPVFYGNFVSAALILASVWGCGPSQPAKPPAAAAPAAAPSAPAAAPSAPAAAPSAPAATASPPAGAATPGSSAEVTSVPASVAQASAPNGSAPAAAPAKPTAPIKPATIAEATKVLDLTTFPVIEGAELPPQRRPARLTYSAPKPVVAGFEFYRQALTQAGWQELPNSYVTEESASGTFAKDGYKISVMAMPGYTPDQKGKSTFSLINHGNIDVTQLPTPDGCQVLFAGPVSVTHLTSQPQAATAEAVRKLFIDAGWEPYGTAGDSQSFKKEAIQIDARVAVAPAQNNQTIIDYSSSLLSADLPAPADADYVQFSDTPCQLAITSKAPPEQVEKYFREALAARGWKATTDKAIELEINRKGVIFRNGANDMLDLEMTPVDGGCHALLKHSTEAEVAELERQFQAEKARLAAEANKPKPQVTVRLPEGAGGVEELPNKIEFTVASGQGKKAYEAIVAQFTADGWTQENATLQDALGTVSLKKGDLSLSVDFVDPGFIPAEVSITSFGAELKKAE